MEKRLSYFELYLKRYFTENDDPRVSDQQLITERADAAAATFEEQRHDGMNVSQAMECAMKVLTADL